MNWRVSQKINKTISKKYPRKGLNLKKWGIFAFLIWSKKTSYNHLVEIMEWLSKKKIKCWNTFLLNFKKKFLIESSFEFQNLTPTVFTTFSKWKITPDSTPLSSIKEHETGISSFKHFDKYGRTLRTKGGPGPTTGITKLCRSIELCSYLWIPSHLLF